jgi:hypothetical protein
MIPALFFNFKKALIPLMHDDTYTAMARVVQIVEDASYKSNDRRPKQESSKSKDRNNNEQTINVSLLEDEIKSKKMKFEEFDQDKIDVCDNINGYCPEFA